MKRETLSCATSQRLSSCDPVNMRTKPGAPCMRSISLHEMFIHFFFFFLVVVGGDEGEGEGGGAHTQSRSISFHGATVKKTRRWKDV